MSGKDIRIGLIGAGYIANWHADAIKATPGVKLSAVCDVSLDAAQGLGSSSGARAFTDLDQLLATNAADAVHILTPPDSHHKLALECLNAGLHVLAEKPVALTGAETREIEASAAENGRRFTPGHNFLGVPSYGRLKTMVAEGRLGRISSAEINWCFPLPPLRSGPFGLWLMREPKNLLLELGPHLFAFVVDLFGPPDIQHLETAFPIELPGGGTRDQGYRILARAGGVAITININLIETIDDRSVILRGSSGMARLDYASDVLVVRKENTADLVANPLLVQFDQAGQHLREGVVNATRQLTSLNQKSPYGLSFRGMLRTVYGDIQAGRAADPRFSGAATVNVMQALDDTVALMPKPAKIKKPRGKPKPTALVIGGTGFLGRNLTRTLVERGTDVRVLSRGRTGPFDDISNHVETVAASLHDRAALTEAMKGIETVFNLARSLEANWEDCLRNDIGVAVNVAEACLAAGVSRLVYTGTIASYDMSDPNVTITEDIAFAEDMSDRNFYARSKAECERRLLDMHETRGLPVSIARPGIVVGAGGPLQHWGIGRWHGAGAVRIWGHGHNILPFVLIDDVSDGLIRMAEYDAAAGQSFNLVGDRMLSARDYFDAIHRTLQARITVKPGSLVRFYAADALKYHLKTKVLGRKGVVRPSLADWKSRAHFSPFDNTRPKEILGWAPETDRAAFIRSAITNADLFGY